MKLKDFITVTLLAVVGFVLGMVGNMAMNAFGVFGMLAQNTLGTIITAPIYFVMCLKVQKRGAAFIYYLIPGIVYMIMGFAPMAVISVLGGIIAEAILFSKDAYKDEKKIGWSFVVAEFLLALHGLLLLVVFGAEKLAQIFPKIFTIEKAKFIENLFFKSSSLLILFGAQIVASILAVLLARYIVNKFFNKDKKDKSVLE